MSVVVASESHTAGSLADKLEAILTPSQLELLALVASGYSYKEIAGMKFLSDRTVENKIADARRRSGARNVTNLCVQLLDARLIRPRGGRYEPVGQDLRIAGE